MNHPDSGPELTSRNYIRFCTIQHTAHRDKTVRLCVDGAKQTGGFTLLELLVTIAIISTLLAIALPVMSKARDTARGVQCGSTLKQSALAMSAYVADWKERLPFIDSAIFRPDGTRDWNADPSNKALYPQEWPQVMSTYLNSFSIMRCPSQMLGYPEKDPVISYRLSSADNLDGKPLTAPQLYNPNGGVVYNWDLKYLNGRRYDQQIKDETYFPSGAEGWPLVARPSAYYVIRDFVEFDTAKGMWLTPHFGVFNQLMLDMHVELVHTDNHHGLTDDRP